MEGEALRASGLGRIGLGGLLALTARRHPDRIALVDPVDKPLWSGRPAITWTYAAAAEIVERLARALRGWRLPPGSRIGLCLPGGSESALAVLAVEAAGHLPCLLPISWDEEHLVAAVQGTGVSAVLTQARFGSISPAERLCTVAARYFGLRYLAAFGPEVPDGVINLDGAVLENRTGQEPPPHQREPVAPCGLVSFCGGDPDRPMHRGSHALIAAAAAHLMAARVGPGERILSLLGGHDLRGLATGLAAALVAGAGLETLPLFDGTAFSAALARDLPTHLVAPGFLEGNLAGRDLPPSLRSLSLVHRAPVRFPRRRRPRDGASHDGLRSEAVVDVVAFDETALLSGRRGGSRDVALTLGRPERLGLPETLMAMRLGADGALSVRGQACAAAPLQRGIPGFLPDEIWRRLPYEPVLSAGLATGIAACAEPAFAPAMDFFATA